jgi:hypothetical protein
MSDFQVGDEVVCVDADGVERGLVKGEKYTITLIHQNGDVAVNHINNDFGWWSKRFEIVTTGGDKEDTADIATDLVNSPPHYQSASGIECIEAIKAQMSEEEYRGYLRGNVVKYLWRYQQKGGKQSLEKACWYLDKLIGQIE